MHIYRHVCRQANLDLAPSASAFCSHLRLPPRYIVMAYVVMAYVVMAYELMAYVVMASAFALTSASLRAASASAFFASPSAADRITFVP